MSGLVYLCGPIYGLSWDGATDWREAAARVLAEKGITALSPLRGKQYLKEERALKGNYEQFPLSSDRGLTTRDHWDVKRCDVVLINFLGAERVSIGSIFEIAWAWAYRKPVVLAMEAEGNVHDYPMVRECVGYRVDHLGDALGIVISLLIP